MIDFAIEAERRGKSPHDAILEAASVRFRGLAFSQVVTLYVTPVFYTSFDALQRRLGRRKVPDPARAEEPEAALVG